MRGAGGKGGENGVYKTKNVQTSQVIRLKKTLSKSRSGVGAKKV